MLTLRGHQDNIWGLAFSADGQKLASASVDNTVRIWDASTLELTRQEHLTLSGHRGAVTDVAFHPTDGRRLVSAGTDGTVRLWDMWSRKELRILDMAPSSLRVRAAFSPDGERLAAVSTTIQKLTPMKMWDTSSFNETRSFRGQTALDQCLAFSSDGRHLASAGYDPYVVRVWETTTDKEPTFLKDHNWPINEIAFRPAEGRQLVSGSGDGTVRVWDWTTGQESLALEPRHTARVQSVAFSRDGKQLASASWDRTIKVWDCATWKLLLDLPDPTGAVLSVAFGADRRLAWGGTDGTVKVWDGPGTEIHVLRGHASWLQAVAFSPDGQWIASASLDGTVKVWKAPPEPEPLAQGTQDPDE
jgi:WD40 repeat protein